MAQRKRGLGRGLDALISPQETARQVNSETEGRPETGGTDRTVETGDTKEITDPNANAIGEGIQKVRITLVEPNPDQPRKTFDPERLEELAQSIREKGLLEPILVQECENPHHYEIIAGERRWRACRMAELQEIPVIIRNFDEQERVEISLIENIQREDLNPIEEARAYRRLAEEFHLKQEEIARKVSKNRTSVANSMRLLKLPESVQDMLADGRLSMGQARALLSLSSEEKQVEIAGRIVEQNLSVREVEKLIRKLTKSEEEIPIEDQKQIDAQTAAAEAQQEAALDKTYQDIAERIQQSLGMKVTIQRKGKSGGRMEISFSSGEDLEQIMDRLIP